MKKLDIKTKEIYTKDEMKRYLGSLAEDFTDKVKGLGEGLKIVMEKQDKQTKILDSHTEILNKHEKILNSQTEMIGNIMENVSTLKDDMQIVKKELKKKVDYDEFLSLVQRVNKLEAKN